MTNDEGKKRDVSIKGVSKELYQKMISFAKSTGKNVGEVTNEAYRDFLSTVEDIKHSARNSLNKQSSNVRYVENIRVLTIDEKTLTELGDKIIFQDMDDLTFDGVSNEEFTKRVVSIKNVKHLTLSPAISKAAAILRCTFVDQIEQK